MKKIFTILSLCVLLMMGIAEGQTAYISNQGNNTVSVINVATNTVASNVLVGSLPGGVSVSLDGTKVYIANAGSNTVSVISTANNTVSATIAVGHQPQGVSVSPDGSKVYVTNKGDGTVSVIDTVTNTVVATIVVGFGPWGISVTPDGSIVYVANKGNNNGTTISVINAITNTVSATITVGDVPFGVSVSPDGTKVYVTKNFNNTVSVINTSTNTVSAIIPVGPNPIGVSTSPDGSKVYVANGNNNTVSVINTSTNSVSNTIAVTGVPIGISFTPDGTKAYVVTLSGIVNVINTLTNTVSNTIVVGSNPDAFGNFISTCSTNTSCSSPFIIYPDSTIQHLYWAINYATGVQPLQYLWSWGDGNTDTIPYPNHTYQDSGVYTICLSITDSTGCQSTYCDSSYHIMRTSNYMVTVNVISNIMTATKNTDIKNEISIYPNPASSILAIHQSSPSPNQQITITNILGEEVYHQPNNSSQSTIDVSKWSRGVYILRIRNEKETVAKKIIIE